MHPIAKDLLQGLTKKFLNEHKPLALVLADCTVSNLKIYGKHDEAAALQKTMNEIREMKW